MAQYASDEVLQNGPQYLKDNVTTGHICIAPAKSDTRAQVIAKSIASVSYASADITIADSGDNLSVTTAAKTGLDPTGTATSAQDIALVFISGTENLACIDITNRDITNATGDTIDIPQGTVTINNWASV